MREGSVHRRTRVLRLLAITLGLLCAACTAKTQRASSPTSAPPSATSPTTPTTIEVAAPWDAPPLPSTAPHASGGPCRAMSFADLGVGAGATPRRLVGNIGVAWDKPGVAGQDPDGRPSATSGRSAFGILANPGANDPQPFWAFRQRWADGSTAGYGYEGEIDPVHDPNPLHTTKWLAQLRIAGMDCSFNVWSNLGRAHLEYLLSQLRYVQP